MAAGQNICFRSNGLCFMAAQPRSLFCHMAVNRYYSHGLLMNIFVIK